MCAGVAVLVLVVDQVERNRWSPILARYRQELRHDLDGALAAASVHLV